jgi:erythromycin esterase
MKKLLTAFLIIFSVALPAQVIRSNTNKVSIRDGRELKKDYWYISPEVRPDVYETVSSSVPHTVTFITDVDSISFRVKTGQKYAFVILLNGKDSAHTQVAGVKQLSGTGFSPPPPFSAAQLKQVQNAAVPFKSITATKPGSPSDYTDLAPFGRLVGNAQIIALGESTHGTSEFFSMKHRILEYAVVNLHVRAFVLEDNQLHVEQINNYVLYGKGKLRSLIRLLFGVWVRQEVVDMIEWLKDYNLQHPGDQVEFIGMDMQSPFMAMDSLDAFLQRKDTALHSRVRQLLGNYRTGFAGSYTATATEKNAWFNNAQKSFDLLLPEKAKWLATAGNRADSTSAEWALQNARVIRQCARGLITGQLKLYRDSAMAENIQWILAMRPAGTRIVVWAHDFHISRGEHPAAANNYYNGISMGSWLSKWYGKDYKAFGLETYSGTFTAMKTYTDFNLVDCALVISPPGTLDEALHQACRNKKSPYLFLGLDQIRNSTKEFKWLQEPTYVRFANHVCEGNSYGLKHAIPYQFDGIFFIDVTKGSTLIK